MNPENPAPPATRPGKMSTLQRGLSTLALLCKERSVGFNAISRHLGVASAVTSRLLKDLIGGQWVQRDDQTGRYVPGERLEQLQRTHSVGQRLTGMAQPALTTLSERTGNTALLVVLDGRTMLYTAKVVHELSLGLREVGTVLDVFTHHPWGWILIQALSPRDQAAALRRDTELSAWMGRMKAGQKALARQGWCMLETRSDRRLGAPIRDAEGRVVAALGLGATTFSLPQSKVNGVGRMLVDAANDMSRALGWPGDDSIAVPEAAG